MRRIISACLLQTMRFDTSNGVDPDAELEVYLKRMDHRKTRYIVEEKKKEADGSLVLKIKKQYNAYNADGYFK